MGKEINRIAEFLETVMLGGGLIAVDVSAVGNSIQLMKDCFLELFPEHEIKRVDLDTDRLFVMLGSVKVFTLSEREDKS